VTGGERIAIFGDYDVDGATSTALLARFFRAVSAAPVLYIPDRMREGYGPNGPALRKLHEDGVALVVTVDCGATAFAALDEAASIGLEVIVCDHHMGEPSLPRAVAVINPNRLDETVPHRQLAAVGVSFLLAIAVNRGLRKAGWYTDGRPEPNLLDLLDLVALGTVCDVVPLTGLNRALVTQGLKIVAQRRNLGLATLADVAGLTEMPDAYHLGYMLGPRVNAGGRVGNPFYGAQLLSTEDPGEARRLAEELHRLNDERRAIEAQVLEAALAQVEDQRRNDLRLVFVQSVDWHAGVIGIVASRLKDRFNRPTFVVAIDGDVAKGSGRSLPGIAMGEAVLAARQAGLLINGGGHAMAAGFTAEPSKLADLAAFLEDRMGSTAESGALIARLGLDGTVECSGATSDLVAQLVRLGPYGAGHAEPRFAIPAAHIVKADVVGDAHVRCILTGATGGRLKAIAFRCLESPLGKALLETRGKPLHIAGHLRADRWQGRDDAQLMIDDAAEA
jgi:single-stranded-DNA-specific exonuclease